jgi:carbamoylphosphate synthase large subunit
MNILIYPCGTEIGLEINRALRYQKGINVFGGNSYDDHSRFYFNDINFVPDIYEDPGKAIEALGNIIIEKNIDYFFPCHDQVIFKVAGVFKEAITPDPFTVQICRSKSKTYQYFKNKLRVPEMFNQDVTTFPVFCKPDQGQGTRGTFMVKSSEELKKRRFELILEYLPGNEYTIDCFTDRHGELRYCQGRERVRITNGISTRTKIYDDPDLLRIAEIINSELSFRGQWFFQTKKDIEGRHVLMEIAPRAAGSSCLARARGVNLPLLTLFDREGKDIEIIENDIHVADRALENKYIFEHDFDNVYVDLDDTLIPINYEMIGLLYKFKSKGKKIFLVTAHKGSVYEALEKNYINLELFDTIYHTKDKDSVIVPSSILIDDSFRERKSVNCPAFDVQQAIEIL